MRKTNLVPLLLPLLVIGLTAAEPAEKKVLADELEAVAGNTLTPEQTTALAAVDVRLAGVEALAAKINEPDYKAEVARQIEDLKKRRLAIEKNFDPGLYEALMHSVISRYQVIALWLKPPPLPPAAALGVAPSMVLGQEDGEKAFESYAALAVGGTWIAMVEGVRFEQSYERILDGRFVQLTMKNGDGHLRFVIGIMPETKACTWWGFDSGGGIASWHMTSDAKDAWMLQGSGKGPHFEYSFKARLTMVGQDTIKEEFLEFVANGVTENNATRTYVRAR